MGQTIANGGTAGGDMLPNPGRRPRGCAIYDTDGRLIGWRRVHVVLRNGYRTKDGEPMGWASGGKGECEWSLTGSPFDIVEYEVIL